MSEQLDDNKKGWMDRMGDTFRFSVTDLDDLSEVKTFNLSLRNFITLVISGILLILLLYSLLVAFTPLRRLVPGYGKIEQNHKFIELSKKVAGLERQIEDQNIYNKSLQKILSGEGTVEDKNHHTSIVHTHDHDDHGHDVHSDHTNHEESEVVKQETKEVISRASIREEDFAMKLNNLYFVPPVYGSVSSKYDPSIDHYGVDVLAVKNSAIKSIARGVVVASDWTAESGNTIAIQHPNNILTVYKHNSVLLKDIGEYVNAGEAIATIGNSGTLTDGPHLHFELWYDGAPVNPESYISFR